ncbi:MAG: hypothetical protein GY938_11455 [Ketobacter sp.]|nr:hypothetical protein [Ketobacter sp.]
MLRSCFVVFVSLLCASCYTGSNDSLRNPVSQQGVSATIQANLPFGAMEAQVAASLYKDGRKQALVGGDIVVASSDNGLHSSILRSIENLGGDYIANIQVDDSGQGVEFAVEHDPVAAREDRWYPVDELLVDPGPGELVGYTFDVNFPSEIMLTSPLPTDTYTSRGQTIALNWNTETDGDQIRLTSVQTCFSGDQSVQWATSTIINSTDTGSHDISVGSLIPSTTVVNAISDFFQQISVMIVSSVLEAYTFGLVSADDIDLGSYNLDYCTISLTVFREISNDLGADISGGYAIGSASDTVTVRYEP